MGTIGRYNPWDEAVPRLTSAEMRNFARELPSPNSVWKIGDTCFEVYRVKDLFDSRWPCEALLELLVHARGSYYVYGNRPPLDEYDTKAAPYLVRAKYVAGDLGNKDAYAVEEWLSDRLVPCKGEPFCAGELEYFMHREKDIAHWLQTGYFQSGEQYVEYTYASNRMCAISPYFQNEADEKSGIKLSGQQRYTALCYTLIRYHFLEDYLKNLGARYKTSILRSRVIEKSMSIKTEEGALLVAFTPAYRFLGLNDSGCIRINRKAHGGTPYRFPGYFFDTDGLVALLRKMLRENQISKKTLVYYLGDAPVVREFFGIGAIRLDSLRDIGALLSECGRVFGSDFTGDTLRALVDEAVPDGPELKISKIETLQENCAEILAAVSAVRQL